MQVDGFPKINISNLKFYILLKFSSRYEKIEAPNHHDHKKLITSICFSINIYLETNTSHFQSFYSSLRTNKILK